LCLFSFNAFAVTVTDLYRVSVAVENQGDESRKLGIQWAFQQLLIKVSGSQDVLNNPTLIEASQNAERYVQGFSYQQDGFDEQIYLQAWFSKALVVPLIKRAQAPIWGENRPLLLNWLAIEPTDNMVIGHFDVARLIRLAQGNDDGSINPDDAPNDVLAESAPIVRGERLLVSNQHMQLHKRFSRAFSERGLPILWPVDDLEDQANLPLNQLWWLSERAIELASQRYQTDAVLAGKLNQSANGVWQYEGILQHGLVKKNIITESDTPMGALTLASGEVGQYFSGQFAIKSDPMNGRSGIRVLVKKVSSFTNYSKVLAYFKNITGVRTVEVAQVDRNNLELYLSLEGSWDKVQRIISLDNKLSVLQEKEFEWTP
jgi:hypothetical protein